MNVWTLKKDYMDKMGEVYKAAAAKVADISDKMDKAKYDKAAVNDRLDLSMDGKNKEAERLNHEIFVMRQQIDDIRAEANKQARAIRADCEKAFYGWYNATPEGLDEKAVAFVNSGVATDAELMRMAEQKSTSRTMKRIIGAKLAQSKDEKTAFYGRMYQQTSRDPHLAAIDNMMGVGKLAMGGGLGGPAGARGFLDRWDYVTRPVYDDAPKVGYTITSAGEYRYYEGEQCPFTDD